MVKGFQPSDEVFATCQGAFAEYVCAVEDKRALKPANLTFHVIDYTEQDFTQIGQHYVLILDNVANRSFSELRRALKPQGTIIPNSGHGGMSYVIKAFVLSPFVRQVGSPLITSSNSRDLVVLKELAKSVKITPVIDRTFPLSETPQAIGYV